jgi:hypothetical protein
MTTVAAITVHAAAAGCALALAHDCVVIATELAYAPPINACKEGIQGRWLIRPLPTSRPVYDRRLLLPPKICSASPVLTGGALSLSISGLSRV